MQFGNFGSPEQYANMLLQNPDGSGVTGLTRGDKLVVKELLHKMQKKYPLVLQISKQRKPAECLLFS